MTIYGTYQISFPITGREVGTRLINECQNYYVLNYRYYQTKLTFTISMVWFFVKYNKVTQGQLMYVRKQEINYSECFYQCKRG